jgi:hypothetical protein
MTQKDQFYSKIAISLLEIRFHLFNKWDRRCSKITCNIKRMLIVTIIAYTKGQCKILFAI